MEIHMATWHKPDSEAGLQITHFGEDGGMLPEPHRSKVKQVAQVTLNDPEWADNGDFKVYIFIQFNEVDDAKVYHEGFYPIVQDLVSFPGDWIIMGDTIIVMVMP